MLMIYDHPPVRTGAYRLGQLLAVLYEEGIVTSLGFTSPEQAIGLVLEQPALVLERALKERERLSEDGRLATIGEDFPIPQEAPTPAEAREFSEGYHRELSRLVLRRWYGCAPYTKEQI